MKTSRDLFKLLTIKILKMKQKLKQIVKVLLSCLVISSLSCENEESSNINQTLTQGEKIIDAEKWKI